METKRIFIVDDNEELARVIQHMLEDEGFEVKLAKDVQMDIGPSLNLSRIWLLQIFRCPEETAWN